MTSDELSGYLDDVFTALRSPKQRLTLTYLDENYGSENPASFDEIADYLTDETEEAETDVRVALQHQTLPTMQDQGMISYDGEHVYLSEDDPQQADILREYVQETVDDNPEYLEEIFDILSNTRRRKTLYILDKEEDQDSDIGTIAGQLADDIGSDVHSERISLAHRVLPSLRDSEIKPSGWVQYDPTEGDVRFHRNPAQERDQLLMKYLNMAYEHETGEHLS